MARKSHPRYKSRSEPRSEPRSERGAALVAALMLVALMAAVSVQLVDLSRFAVFRTANAGDRSEAYWSALGAREFAEGIVLQTAREPVLRGDAPWLSEAQVFPVERGVITGRVRDGNNCLNINALAEAGREAQDEGAQGGDVERARAMYDALMRAIGAPPGSAQRLKAQIIDWIDADARPEPGGAEDETYQGFNPPYRAANQRFSELEELLALAETTPELYAALSPWLCVRPSARQPALNVNTLSLDQAPLLSAAFQGRLSAPDAEAVLFRRPPRGYDALEAFWADPLIARIEIDGPQREAISVTSRWFEMSVDVELGAARFTFSQLAELTDGGGLIRHRQRFGAAS